MEIRIIKNVNRFYHRSWFNYWEVIFYFRAVSTSATDRYELLRAFHDYYYDVNSYMINILLLVPFEAVLKNVTSTVIGEHVTYSTDMDIAMWQGARFNPLNVWVPSNCQFRIRWHHPSSRETWYTDFPYSYRFDWTGNFLKPALRNSMELFADDIIIPQEITPGTTVSFARHDRTLGYLPVKAYTPDRHAYSDNRRRWSY